MSWKKVGKLNRKRDFRLTSRTSPLEALHRRIDRLTDESVTSVSDIAVSPRTNEYLYKQLIRQSKQECPWAIRRYHETVAEFAMFQYSPADLEGAEDFYLYVRTGE